MFVLSISAVIGFVLVIAAIEEPNVAKFYGSLWIWLLAFVGLIEAYTAAWCYFEKYHGRRCSCVTTKQGRASVIATWLGAVVILGVSIYIMVWDSFVRDLIIPT